MKCNLCFSKLSPTETAPFSRRSKYGSDVVSTLAERSVGTDFTIGPRSATSGKRYLHLVRALFKKLFILFLFCPCSAGPSINLKSSGKCQFCPSVAVRHSRSHTPTNQSSIKNTSRSKHHHYENCCIISKFHQK